MLTTAPRRSEEDEVAKIKTSGRSSDQIAERVSELVERAIEAAQREVRRGLADELAALTVSGRGRANLALILDEMGRSVDEVNDSFLAGIKFAAQLAGDDDFEC
jgi:hypothetical protein